MNSFLPSSIQLSGHQTLYGIADSFGRFVLMDLAKTQSHRPIIAICRHDNHLNQMAKDLEILDPTLEVLKLPAWDCLPYDRVSPKKDIIGKRVQTLTCLLQPQTGPRLILTTIASFFQRVPSSTLYKNSNLDIKTGKKISRKDLESYFIAHGFSAVTTVRESGEFSFRGGIVDFFPASADQPYRLDLFGEEIEEIKNFDPLTQLSTQTLPYIYLSPTSELLLNQQTITHFRMAYRQHFGAACDQDPLYQAISAGRHYPGAEHWLSLFYPKLDTLLDYVDDPVVCFEHQTFDAVQDRWKEIQEYYEARVRFKEVEKGKTNLPYHPVTPHYLYPTVEEIEQKLASCAVLHFSPFAAANTQNIDLNARPIPDFSASRHAPDIDLFDHVKNRIQEAQNAHKKVIIACHSDGSQHRLVKHLKQKDIVTVTLNQFSDLDALALNQVGLIQLSLDYGFDLRTLLLIAEHDIFGEPHRKSTQRQRRSDLLIGEVASLTQGDFVVHQEHGIGQFVGLLTLTVGNVPHDCLSLVYENGDKLFVPVENMDVLSRYGGESMLATLDRLGSSAWQNRKAKIKKRIHEIAKHLIKLAAERMLRKGEIFHRNESLYQEFTTRFPYQETEDQGRVIEETLEDLGRGKPMDRLVCGDVGFGKTEVAMRAAFVVAAAGRQVALIVPTTLLCRQHFRNFQERYKDLGFRIEQLSRLVMPKDAKQIKEDITKGTVDIVIGTHTLLGSSVKFKSLALVIVDEEQHFGVKQKEKLKELQKDTHLLTLSATPIPRTLQMALSGVRDLSLITTPPIDRLAVHTFVLPFDPVVIREAIMRELHRGGQVFYVSPRVEDLTLLSQRLKELVPEARTVIAHGQLPATSLEQVMNDFYDKKYEILLSTNIIESGLDMPTVNTMIIHRSDLFGLSQLYQLRGRVGRGKMRGYAYLTLPVQQNISSTAQKRLEVMQTLDSLGAGFQLASHDMDIRGAGNLLGEEQSGHIREVGVELYQQMLDEAIHETQNSLEATPSPQSWSPQLNLGLPVLIPDTYVMDLAVRLNLYRRLSSVESSQDIQQLEDEFIDRFGPLPEEVENLLSIVQLKQICRDVGIEKVDVGEKGCVFTFFNQTFSQPLALVRYVASKQGVVRLRPDHKLVYLGMWKTPSSKVNGVKSILQDLKNLMD
ncbi:MAG: transcription-repair coupling factor [Janthinobacterium lividum]